MLRSFLALAPLLLLTVTAARAQTPLPAAPEPVQLVATYQLRFQPDSTNPASARTERLFLEMGKSFSRFESEGKRLSDSLTAGMGDAIKNSSPSDMQDQIQRVMDKISAGPRTGFRHVIYKATAGRAVWFVGRIGTATYRYEEPVGFLTWTIAAATATIGGYACQRATTTFGGRQWEAWFTREVPVSDGPYKFGGLPGLIVKVSDARQHYVYELLSLRKPSAERLLTFPVKTTAASKAAYLSAAADFNRDPMGRINASAPAGAKIILANPEQSQQTMRERARKNNNPLELK